MAVLVLCLCTGFSLVAATLCCSVQASHCGGSSCCGAQALGRVGFSSCGSRPLEHRLSSCGAQAWLLCDLSDRPRPGIKRVSPALAGAFFTSEPPGKPVNTSYMSYLLFRFKDGIIV